MEKGFIRVGRRKELFEAFGVVDKEWLLNAKAVKELDSERNMPCCNSYEEEDTCVGQHPAVKERE